LIVRRLADVVPLTGLCASNNELREGVMGAGRAGDSEEGGESVLHLDRARIYWGGDLDGDVVLNIRGSPRIISTDAIIRWWSRHAPGIFHITVLGTLVWYFILRTERTRCRVLYFRRVNSGRFWAMPRRNDETQDPA
jgi:hypothetical protein